MGRTTFAMLVLVMLVSLGISNSLAYAQEGSHESSERKFLLQEIYHSFDVSEPYVEFGENNHVTLDTELMKADGISALDIEIITKWIAYTNILTEAMISNNHTEVDRILADLKAGQFSLLVNYVDE